MELFELADMNFEDFKKEFESLTLQEKTKKDEYGYNILQYAFSYYSTDIIKYLLETNLFDIAVDMNEQSKGVPLKNKVPFYIIQDAINLKVPNYYFTENGLFEKYLETIDILKEHGLKPEKLSYDKLYENYLLKLNKELYSRSKKIVQWDHIQFWARITSEPLMSVFKENDLFDNRTLTEILYFHSNFINSIKEDTSIRGKNVPAYEPEEDDIENNLLMKKIMQYPDFSFVSQDIELVVRLGLCAFKNTNMGMPHEEMISMNKKSAISYMQENNLDENELKCEILLYKMNNMPIGDVQFATNADLLRIKNDCELFLKTSFPFLSDKNIKITEKYMESIISSKNMNIYNLFIKDDKSINNKNILITEMVKKIIDEKSNYKPEILDLLSSVNEPELSRFKNISVLSYLMEKEEEKFISIYENKYKAGLKKKIEPFNDDNFKNKIDARIAPEMLKATINDCYGANYGYCFSDIYAKAWEKYSGYEDYKEAKAKPSERVNRPVSEKNISCAILKTIFQSKLTFEEIEQSLREIKGNDDFLLRNVLTETVDSNEEWSYLYNYASSMEKIDFLKEKGIKEPEHYDGLKTLKNVILCDDNDYKHYILEKSFDFDEDIINSFIYNVGTSIHNTNVNLERNIIFFEDTINSIFDFIAMDSVSKKKFKDVMLFIQEAKKYNGYYAGKEVLVKNIEQGGAKVSESFEAIVEGFISIDEKFIEMEKKVLLAQLGTNNNVSVKKRM